VSCVRDLAHLSVEIESQRFVVRTLKPEDVGSDYVEWFSDPVVSAYIAYRPGVDAIQDLRRFVAEHDARRDSLLFGVFDSFGRHVANMKYDPIDLRRRRAVLGVLVGDQRWRGAGLFKEVFRATSDFLATRLGVLQIELSLSPDNLAAKRAYERTGFTVVPPAGRGDDSLWMECLLGSRTGLALGTAGDEP